MQELCSTGEELAAVSRAKDSLDNECQRVSRHLHLEYWKLLLSSRTKSVSQVLLLNISTIVSRKYASPCLQW